MPDNLKITHPDDAKRINIHEPYELRDWSQKFGVTPDRLRQAVAAVGDRVTDVKRYLGK